MGIDKQTKFGSITISSSAIEAVALDAALDCYGVVAVTNKKKFRNKQIEKILKIDEQQNGVEVKKTKDGWAVNIFIIVTYGLKLTEIIGEVQKSVKYSLEKTFDITFAAINVYIEGVKVID